MFKQLNGSLRHMTKYILQKHANSTLIRQLNINTTSISCLAFKRMGKDDQPLSSILMSIHIYLLENCFCEYNRRFHLHMTMYNPQLSGFCQ